MSRILRASPSAMRLAVRAVFCWAVAVAPACTPPHAEHPGQTDEEELAAASEQREASNRDADPNSTADGADAGAAAAPQEPVDPEAIRRAKEWAVVQELLGKAESPPEENRGLVLVVGERAADLVWTMAIENRGTETFQLGADLQLLELEIAPPSGQAEATTGSPVAQPYRCNADGPSPLKRNAELESISLGPGDVLVHSFDPRKICPEDKLVRGATITPRYGYAELFEKKWFQGKSQMMPKKGEPYVATVTAPLPEPPPANIPRWKLPKTPPKIGVERITAEALTLGETYPLWAISPRAETDPVAQARARAKAAAPPEPLRVTVADLPTSSSTTYRTLDVTIANTSGKPLDLVLRRELFVFEVQGPKGSVTCQMEPAVSAPVPSQFVQLAPGASRSILTRLPEACPVDTFSEPGQYGVFVRYRSPSDGKEFGKSGFQGTVSSRSPATFVLLAKRQQAEGHSGFLVRRIEAKPPLGPPAAGEPAAGESAAGGPAAASEPAPAGAPSAAQQGPAEPPAPADQPD